MPYSIDKVDDLPENVRKLSDKQRETWVNVWNSAYDRCKEDGQDDARCESSAFAQANGTIEDAKAGRRNSAIDLSDIQDIHDKAAKLGADCKGGKKEKYPSEMHKALIDHYQLPYNAKALELERQAYQVKQAWYAKYDPRKYNEYYESKEPMKYWCKGVYPEFIIVEDNETGHLYKYDYFIDSSGVVHFEEPVRVEMIFTQVGNDESAIMPKTVIWSCGIKGHEHVTPQEAHQCIKQTSLNTSYVRSEFVKSAYLDNALKAISKDDDNLIVANYMVLFGGRDLEGIASRRINPDGTKGEYFTKNTQFESDYTQTGQLLIDWEHRTQPDGVGPDPEDIFGYVDWKSAIIDEAGLFVNRVLNRRNRYVKMLEALIEAGMIGTSTEPVQKGVEKGEDGEIKTWPLKRDSLSVQPMDYRMLSVNHLELVKALRTNPDGKEIYETVFELETARAKAAALSLKMKIGESSYGS